MLSIKCFSESYFTEDVYLERQNVTVFEDYENNVSLTLKNKGVMFKEKHNPMYLLNIGIIKWKIVA